jgi:hypothetical protein
VGVGKPHSGKTGVAMIRLCGSHLSHSSRLALSHAPA